MAQTKEQRLALRTREAARLLGVTSDTLRRWTREGLIPGKRIGATRTVLYDLIELREWMANREGNQ